MPARLIAFLVAGLLTGCGGGGAGADPAASDSPSPTGGGPSQPAASPAPATPRPAWGLGRVFDRVLVVVLENQDYEDAVSDPYLARLASRGALFSSFYARFRPSYPNYLAMVGGRFFGTSGNTPKDIDAPSIADLLEARGLAWKQYAEGYPGNCFLGEAFGKYVRKHVPFISFTRIQRSPARCANVVPGTDFDPHTLPNLAFYSPDMDNSGHDTGLAFATRWLEGFLEPLLADEAFMRRTLVVVTFDEAGPDRSNRIYTAFIGPAVRPGHVDRARRDHYDLLRTIEENFAVGTLHAEDERAAPITAVWR